MMNLHEKVKIVEYPNRVIGKPMVSINVVTYQHKDYISQCIDGIIMQKTNFQFEILLGEDESTDGTREICVEYAKKYPDKIRLFLHSRENNIVINGQPTGRFNMLYNLSEARGKYIALCEGDDYWTDPLKLQKQIDFLETNPGFVASVHHTKIIAEEERVKSRDKFAYNKSEVKKRDLYNGWIFHSNSLVFRNINFEMNHWDFKVFIDSGLAIMLSNYGKIGVIKEIMSTYRLHAKGATGRSTLNRAYKSQLEYITALRNQLGYRFFFGYHFLSSQIKAIYSINYPDTLNKSNWFKYYYFFKYGLLVLLISPRNFRSIIQLFLKLVKINT